MGMSNLTTVMSNFGVSSEQACFAIKDLSAHIPPFTEEDIERIKINPSLSIVSRIRIIKQMRKQMRGES